MAEKLFKNDPPVPPNPSPIWNAGDGLGTKIEKVFVRVVQGVILWGWGWFAEIAVHVFDASMKILKPGMMRMFTPIIDEALKVPNMPPSLKAMLENVKKETGEAGAVGVGVIAVAAGYQLLSAALVPLSNQITHLVSQVSPYQLINPDTLSLAKNRGIITQELYEGVMRSHGFEKTGMSVMDAMALNHASLGDLLEFLRRGLINEQEFNIGLKRLGFPSFYEGLYKDLKLSIPPINDLIRFMVREAFDEGIVSKYGYDADYPSDIDQYLPKVGLDAFWGNKYWRAHWTLPSPTQAYEMLHRGLINSGDLDALLKAADYPQFWRDKLMKISYNPYTRVDVRRLLQAGIITREDAKQNYRDQGYDEDKAEKLTLFAEQGISQEEKDLTRADLVGMYVDGLTDRGATSANLIKMGYDASEAEAILKQADFNIVKAARVDAINYVKERYIVNQISRLAAQTELSAAGLNEKSYNRYLLAWDRQKQTEVKGLSASDAKRLYKKELIDEAEFKKALEDLNYSARAVELFIKEANLDITEGEDG